MIKEQKMIWEAARRMKSTKASVESVKDEEDEDSDGDSGSGSG